jgi:NitT/TauT family transport system ATP-binding protein/sulfonate transport system ATP-binding protein
MNFRVISSRPNAGQAVIAPAGSRPTDVALDRGGLAIRNLDKIYHIDDRSLPVLQDINLNIRPGEFVSIVGPSGCGKSTLLRLVVGLDNDYTGTIELDGQAITGTSLDRGIVFQDHRLFPWMTVEQNIALALSNREISTARKRKLVADHIRLVNLVGFEKAYPHQLSGGMAQRAAIARALVNEPKILLLDEPLGALDALTRVYLQNELQRIWMEHRSTVIMVTHDVEEAVYLGDHIVVMGANPGTISQVIPVSLPHPRDRASPLLRRLRDDILAELIKSPAPDLLIDLPRAEIVSKQEKPGPKFVW